MPAGDTDMVDRPRSSPTDAPTGTPRTLRVLVVEDNADVAELLVQVLVSQGHAASMAADGAEALRAVAAQPVDVVLLDLGLPDMDGLEVARRIHVAWPDVHVVALTGYAAERIAEPLREGVFADHLLKPVDIAALRGALAKVVR